jgi:hypothetical protein
MKDIFSTFVILIIFVFAPVTWPEEGGDKRKFLVSNIIYISYFAL